MSLITFLSSFLFKRLSFFSCEIATLSLNFRLTTSPAFAELYIQRVEEIHVYRMIHTSRLWLRKVEDTFVITKYDKIETLHELNKFNCKVQFTCESATKNTLPFLDCLIKRDNEGRLQTKVYRKKTHTGQYMHYTSNQPEHVKIGTIKTLVRRAIIVALKSH